MMMMMMMMMMTPFNDHRPPHCKQEPYDAVSLLVNTALNCRFIDVTRPWLFVKVVPVRAVLRLAHALSNTLYQLPHGAEGGGYRGGAHHAISYAVYGVAQAMFAAVDHAVPNAASLGITGKVALVL